ncbi:MAG: ABC transporter ATP-binding protein [Candidatus Eisenbacteria bacterium]|nr:ABC transporter ATP-binding protein [Candidatus Eisenbacteria bacterium]MCC7141120.1 ABC transporter ATP-binding protein [Candidatus Eisenbacteria bacterium]
MQEIERRDGRPPVVLGIRDLVKVYGRGEGEVTALRGVSFDVQRGEFVAIMGSSGSGKSTLMNLIGCLDRPTRGTYLLDGEDVSLWGRDQLAEVRSRRIGFVFQSFNLLPRTSALENVELPLLYRATPAGESGGPSIAEQARQALVRVGLGERVKHHPSQLSGGQQQRVAIARALVNQPSLLLADEPTGNLDSRTSIEIMRLFQELNAGGMTIILITHEVDISEYARRVITLRDGRILSDHPIAAPRDAAAELARAPEPE